VFGFDTLVLEAFVAAGGAAIGGTSCTPVIGKVVPAGDSTAGIGVGATHVVTGVGEVSCPPVDAVMFEPVGTFATGKAPVTAGSGAVVDAGFCTPEFVGGAGIARCAGGGSAMAALGVEVAADVGLPV